MSNANTPRQLDRGTSTGLDYALLRTVGAVTENPVTVAVKNTVSVLANPFKRDRNRTNLREEYSKERSEWKSTVAEVKFERKVFTADASEFTEDEQAILRRYAVTKTNKSVYGECNFEEVLHVIRTEIHPEPKTDKATEPKVKRRLKVVKVVEA